MEIWRMTKDQYRIAAVEQVCGSDAIAYYAKHGHDLVQRLLADRHWCDSCDARWQWEVDTAKQKGCVK